jgi:hypothetical protein
MGKFDQMFPKRKKGQRREKVPADVCGFETNGIKPFEAFLGRVTLIEEVDGFNGFGGRCRYELLAVKSKLDGRTYPCYRTASAEKNFMICHDSNFLSI